jgi:FkbM family methyltransferase
VRSRIEEKIERNQLTNVTVHPVGIGERREWLPYYAPLGANTGTGSFDECHAVDRNRLFGKLELVNGDEYFEANGISKIDLIKIDAEGWEQYVLIGLRETLARCKPAVLLEISASTLKAFSGPEKLRQCIPNCYDAVYVEFTRNGTRYSPFDATRAGDVLLRA